MSDVEAIDAVFGEHRSTLARIERVRTKANTPVQRTGTPWGLNPDPKQRLIGLGLIIISALVLILLAAKAAC